MKEQDSTPPEKRREERESTAPAGAGCCLLESRPSEKCVDQMAEGPERGLQPAVRGWKQPGRAIGYEQSGLQGSN